MSKFTVKMKSKFSFNVNNKTHLRAATQILENKWTQEVFVSRDDQCSSFHPHAVQTSTKLWGK